MPRPSPRSNPRAATSAARLRPWMRSRNSMTARCRCDSPGPVHRHNQRGAGSYGMGSQDHRPYFPPGKPLSEILRRLFQPGQSLDRACARVRRRGRPATRGRRQLRFDRGGRQYMGPSDPEGFRGWPPELRRLRRPHANCLLYCAPPHRRSHSAPPPEPSLQHRRSFRISRSSPLPAPHSPVDWHRQPEGPPKRPSGPGLARLVSVRCPRPAFLLPSPFSPSFRPPSRMEMLI